MIVRVLQYDVRSGAANAQLRSPALPVSEEQFGSQPLVDLAEDMHDTILEHRAKGLAANQCAVDWKGRGLEGSPALFLVCLPDEKMIVSACNPEVEVHEDEGWELGEEGCMSFSGVITQARAPKALRLKARTVGGEEYVVELTDFEARAAWHEVGHLKGEVILDRLGTLAKRVFLKDLAKARKGK